MSEDESVSIPFAADRVDRGRRRGKGPRRPARPGIPAGAEVETGDAADARFAIEWFGTHHVCPRPGCRRAGRCMDEDRSRPPFCFGHYRGTIFCMMELFAAQLGMEIGGPAGAASRSRRRATAPRRATCVLDTLVAAGEPIDFLRRPADSGPDDHDWTDDPEMLAACDRLRAGAGG